MGRYTATVRQSRRLNSLASPIAAGLLPSRRTGAALPAWPQLRKRVSSARVPFFTRVALLQFAFRAKIGENAGEVTAADRRGRLIPKRAPSPGSFRRHPALPPRHGCGNFSCRIRSMKSRNVAEMVRSGRRFTRGPDALGRCFTVSCAASASARLVLISTLPSQCGPASHRAQSFILADGIEPGTWSGCRCFGFWQSRHRRSGLTVCEVGSGEARRRGRSAESRSETSRGRNEGTTSA